MHNIKLTLAYDGTEFSGWQIQPGQRTVQGEVTEVLRRITQEPLTLHGAGRTDAGVHARGQVASFKTHSELAPEEFLRASNALLSPDVRVCEAAEAAPGFHARWDAQGKLYRYRIFRGPVVSPFRWRYVLHETRELNFAAMAEAAKAFEGEHDFSTFAASSGSEEEDESRLMTRIIYESTLTREGSGHECEEWSYMVRGRSFLRYMVRKIVGTLLEVGHGKLAPADIGALFEVRDRNRSGPTVPPHGLCLEAVEYPDPTDSLGAMRRSGP